MNGGFENAPSTFSKKFVSIGFFYGECFLKSGGKKIPLAKTADETGGFLINGKKSNSWKNIEAPKQAEGMIIKNGDSLVTGKNGYIARLSFPPIEEINEKINISIFPESEIILNIKTAKRSEQFKNPNSTTGTKSSEFDIIEGFELVKGLFNLQITTSKELSEVIKINPKYPKITFIPSFGRKQKIKSINMSLELANDGSIVIFNLLGYDIVHEKSKVIAKTIDSLAMASNPKITINQSGIYITDMTKTPDFRVEEIKKKFMELYKLENYNLMKKNYEEQTSSQTLKIREDDRIKGIKQEIINEECKEHPDEKMLNFLKKQLNSAPSILVSTENKNMMDKYSKDYKPSMAIIESSLPQYSALNESDKVIVKDVKRTVKSYDTVIGEVMQKQDEIDEMIRKQMLPAGAVEKYKKMQSEGKSIPPQVAEIIRLQKEVAKKLDEGVKNLASDKGIVAQTASNSLNESITYNKTLFKFTKAEKGTEINMARAPAGKEFLFIYFDSTNKSASSQFFSPDEEFRLICSKEIIPLRNYRMETNKDSNKTYFNEQLFFVVPQEAKEFTLEVGKKTLPKQNVKIKL
jgi:hypothetical protein